MAGGFRPRLSQLKAIFFQLVVLKNIYARKGLDPGFFHGVFDILDEVEMENAGVAITAHDILDSWLKEENEQEED